LIFINFDRDQDAALNSTEFVNLVNTLFIEEGTQAVTEEQYSELVSGLGADPKKGIDFKDLQKIYQQNERDVGADYERLKLDVDSARELLNSQWKY